MNSNAANWFVDRHVEEGRSEKTAFREAWAGGRELSYGELAENSGKVASALANAGIRREERAVMLVLDQIEFPSLFWGCIKAGVLPVPLNTLLSTDIYRAILDDSRASIAFVSVELLEVVLPAVKDSAYLRQIVVIGEGAPANTLGWESFMKDAKPVKAIECSGDEIALWLYSSGSTGTPKGVRHVHSSLRVTCDNYGSQVLRIQQDDVIYSVAKLFFAYGLGNGMSFPLAVGATSLLYNARPTPESVSAIFNDYQPTIFCGVPTLYAALMHSWEVQGAVPDAPLRTCVSAGEALPAELGRKWKSIYNVDVMDGVGTTEMLHIFLSNRPDDIEYGTAGVAVPGYEVRLVDDEGCDVGEGVIGELLVRGDSAAADYWNQRAKTRATFEGEWTRTGDKYELSPTGRMVYCGRTDDMFKVSGIWVSPFEIEQALMAHPDVLEAAVVARRDENELEKPQAFVVLKDSGHTEVIADLKDFVKEQVGKWKYPRWVEIVDELPKTATGKIQRFKLREIR